MRFAAVFIAMGLIACKPAAPTLDPSAEPIARAFFEDVRRNADLDAEPHLAHELKNPTSEAQIAEFRSQIPQDEIAVPELKSWDARTDSTGTTTRLTEVYHYGDQLLVAQTALFKSPGGVDPVIVGFRVCPATEATLMTANPCGPTLDQARTAPAGS
jgi:hypothetical protein